MYKEIQGNIFDVGAQTIVNPVNCRGTMGAGLAKQFALRFPEMVPSYKSMCAHAILRLGLPHLIKETNPWILLFPTKDHWKENSKLWAIEQGLVSFRDMYTLQGITSIAFPKLGCGLGGLSWEQEVGPLMKKYLSDLSIPVWVIYS